MKSRLVTCTVVLLAGATALAAPKKNVGIGKSFRGPVGLQLYSLRADFAKDVPGTLDRVKGFGLRYAELAGTYGLSPEHFRGLIVARDIIPIAGHFSYERFRDEPERVARDAKAIGLKYAGIAWIPHQGTFDEKECLDAIAVFNRAGRVLSKHGVKFFYHNHGYEFQPFGTGTLFDLMMAETDPKLVWYEMDVFWVVHPAQDPVALLEKYGKRWALMHLKDMKKGLRTGELTGQADVTNDVVLGTGQIPIAAVLRAAAKAGVKYYFIEDESPAAADQIPLSLEYLETVRW